MGLVHGGFRIFRFKDLGRGSWCFHGSSDGKAQVGG